MDTPPDPLPKTPAAASPLVMALSERQRTTLRVQAGRRVRGRATVDVSSGGLLAIGALVSAILLSTSVLVGVATARRPPR